MPFFFGGLFPCRFSLLSYPPPHQPRARRNEWFFLFSFFFSASFKAINFSSLLSLHPVLHHTAIWEFFLLPHLRSFCFDLRFWPNYLIFANEEEEKKNSTFDQPKPFSASLSSRLSFKCLFTQLAFFSSSPADISKNPRALHFFSHPFCRKKFEYHEWDDARKATLNECNLYTIICPRFTRRREGESQWWKKKSDRKSERMKWKERKHLNDYDVLLSITSSLYERLLSFILSSPNIPSSLQYFLILFIFTQQ